MKKRGSIFGNGRLVAVLFVILVIFLSASLSLAFNTTAQPVPQPADESAWFRSGGEETEDGRVFARANELAPSPSQTASTAGSMTFKPVADSDVVENYPDLNMGSTTEIWAGYDDRPDHMGGILRGLVKFDISGLPADATITSATLRMAHVTSWGLENESLTMTTHRVTGDWSELGVTWNNQPGFADSYGSQSILWGDWNWFDFDMTSLVTDWHENVSSNYGIMIRGPEVSQTGFRGFASRETNLKPELIVQYDLPYSCSEGLVNGGFEERTGWELPPTEYTAIYTEEKVRSGSWSVRNGITNELHNRYSYSSAWQTVTLPQDATSINLDFYLWPQTTEPTYLSLPSSPLDMRQTNATSSGDAQLVLILNESGKEIERLLMMRKNLEGDAPWLYYNFDLSHYAGRTIRVYFDVYNNGWAGITSMYVDDVSLQVCTGTPPGDDGTIEGTVILQSRSDHSGAEVCADDGSSPVCVLTDEAGAYSIDAAEGSYTVSIEMARYLDGEKLNVPVTEGVVTSLQPVTLLGGDTNDDCVLNILDMSLVGGRFGMSCGDPNWDSRADINDDCTVNILDLSVTGGNFGGACPVPWD
jgi:hypothetical protein